MKIYELPFGKFIELNDAFLEMIIYEGVELTAKNIEQLQDYLIQRRPGPNGILINKINEYTYTFDAQMQLGKLQHLDAVAVVTYTQISRRAIESIIEMHRHNRWNIKLFDKRKLAIEWLETEIEKKKTSQLESVL